MNVAASETQNQLLSGKLSYFFTFSISFWTSNYFRYHGKELVKDGGRFHITSDKDQTLYHIAKLEITNVVAGDKGEYRVVAQNKHGEGVATINLNFEGGAKPKWVILECFIS